MPPAYTATSSASNGDASGNINPNPPSWLASHVNLEGLPSAELKRITEQIQKMMREGNITEGDIEWATNSLPHLQAQLANRLGPPAREQEKEEKETMENMNISDEPKWAFSKLQSFESTFASSEDSTGLLPNEQTCLAHLKLLEAFYALKDEIAYTDGHLGIYDNRAHGTEESVAGNEAATRKRLESLAAIREKRWTLFVARATERYDIWWKFMLKRMDSQRADKRVGLIALPKLTTSSMAQGDDWFNDFVDNSQWRMHGNTNKHWEWTANMLPPLDVLMVWHSHQLNPRSYLEDCMRNGMRGVWYAGMPWKAINQIIDDHFRYGRTDEAVNCWAVQVRRHWDNIEDSMKKTIKCPRCQDLNEVPWTTSSAPEDMPTPWNMEHTGHGYGEREFSHDCRTCEFTITHEILKIARFKADTEDLLRDQTPMKGTIVPGTRGLISQLRRTIKGAQPYMFPNNLLQLVLRQEVLGLCSFQDKKADSRTMEDVKTLIEECIRKSENVYRAHLPAQLRRPRLLWRDERLAIRQMMARYWDNHSPFSLDLSAAVIRQGVFVDKMHHLDWLHSPNAREIMGRIIRKYNRFFTLMAENDKQIAVPTLDVDLGWHTQQLSPRNYFSYSVQMTGFRFIDHDDKISSTKLSTAFEWTSKAYEKRYGEVYSECTCWYCEAIRASHVSAVSGLFGARQTKHEKISDAFHSSKANLCLPDQSAHISTHNAIPEAPESAYDPRTARRHKVEERQRLAMEKQLNDAYEKACKRAIKKGRQPPQKKEFREKHYGFEHASAYPYRNYYATPFMYPYGLYYMPPVIGGYGSCAAGTCGGTVATGNCAVGGNGWGGSGGDSGSGGCGSSGGCASGGGDDGGGGGGCGGGGGDGGGGGG